MRIKLVLLAAMGAASVAAMARPTDDEAIRAVEARQEAAWNAHDAKAYAWLFSEDADTVNVLGWWWKSRAELEEKLGNAFAFVFSRSVLHVEDVSVRHLSHDLVVAQVRWSMSGALSPDGSGSNIPEHGIQMQVLRRDADGWRIVSFQNTNAVPERPFPKAPPAH